MINLIKVLIVIAIASFSMNASAYVIQNGDGSEMTKKEFKLERKQLMQERRSLKQKLMELREIRFSKMDFDSRKAFKKARKEVRMDKREVGEYLRMNKKALRQLKVAYTNMDGEHGKPGDDNGSGDDNGHNVPEPGMVGLLAIGLLGMVARRKLRA